MQMLPKQFQRRRFFQKSTNQKQELHVVMADQDEMSNLHRGHSIDDSYQVSMVAMFAVFIENIPQMLPTKFRFIWPSGFRGEDFKKIGQSETKNCLSWLCLVMDHNKMCTLQRGPSIDASYQVSVHLADGFQRRRLKCEK